jgi:nitrite reductase/ring-hydroxylating ferredoxin subunit
MIMRKKINILQNHTLRITIVTLIFSFLLSCDPQQFEIGDIPYVFVFVELNLNAIENQNLQRDRGYVQVEGGYKGIVVYRENQNSFKALDRTCSVDPLDPCAKVEVHSSGFYLECPCCNSQFDFDGFPIAGIAERLLRPYFVIRDGNFLLIRSELN